jgi:glycerophosphoryl diester phosphodiesterase
VVAHRGAAAEAPENTLEAFDLAAELGADALELDVRRAGDGTLAVIHDATLERTTPASGPVSGRGARELRELGVPALPEVLDRHPDLPLTVDVKDPDATADVVDLVRGRGRVEDVVLYVESGTGLPAFRDYPGRRATSTGQALRWALLERWIPGRPGAAFPEVVHTPLRRWGLPVVTPGFVETVHRAGRTLQVWTVNDEGRMRRLADWGVDAIVTDEVRRAVRIFGARRAEDGPSPEAGGSGRQ